MPRLSCVIPVVGTTDGLEATLVSVLEQRPEGCEIVVVLNTPYDDPYHLKDEIRFLESPGSSWVSCAALGVRVSRAPFLHLLASGCEVTPGWVDAALRHFGRPEVAAVAPVVLSVGDNTRVMAAGVSYHPGGRRRVLTQLGSDDPHEVLGPTFDAAFFRKSAIEVLGDGLPTVLGSTTADVDLALTMQWAGYRAILEPRCQVHAAKLLKPPASGFEQGLFEERLFWRNCHMTNRIVALLTHPMFVASDLVASVFRGTTLTQIAGRFQGLWNSEDYRLHHQWLRVIREVVATEREIVAPARLQSGLRLDAAHTAKRGSSAAPAPARAANP